MMFLDRFVRAAMAGAGIALVLASCGGGAGSTVQAVPKTPGSAGTAPLAFTIKIPFTKGTAAQTRRPRYVSPATQSVDVTVGAMPAVTLNVSASSPQCTLTPAMTEYNTPYSQPNQLALASDGYMWIAAQGGGAIRIAPGGSIDSQYLAQNSLRSYALDGVGTIGADVTGGKVWLGHYYGDPVYNTASIAPGGWYNAVSIGTANYVGTIASGADNNVWYSNITVSPAPSSPPQAGGNTLSRIAGGSYDNAGPYGAASSAISRIKRGTDGSIWFTEVNGKLGHLTFTGTTPNLPFGEYSTGSSGSTSYGPIGLAVGPDNSVYLPFIDGMGNTTGIAHVSSSGSALPTIPLTGLNGVITDIAYGPDGALWIATASDSVGRLTTSGTYTAYLTGNPIPVPSGTPTAPPTASPGSGVQDVAVGSDNLVYFTERNSLRYGTIGLSSACSGTIAAPVGATTASVRTYDLPGGAAGGGHLLAQTLNAPVLINANAANTLSFVLDGVADHVTLTVPSVLQSSNCGAPYTGTAAISAVAYDASGNPIVGTAADSSGSPLHVTLSAGDAYAGNTDSFTPGVLSWPSTTTSTFHETNGGFPVGIGGTPTGSPPAILPHGITGGTITHASAAC